MMLNSKEIKLIKDFNGHSGCVLSLFLDNDKKFVRKRSSSISYNARLKRQCKKQANLASNIIKAPEVYNYGYEDNLFYFDMEYIEGKTIAEYLPNIISSEIPQLMQLLFDNLYMQNLEKIPRTNEIFNTKIEQLKKTLVKNKNLREPFQLLSSFNWDNVDKSPCHGDLTMENIIITPSKQLYLIDFLDSFYNSWMLDIAKLLQDLELKWSIRNIEENSNTNIRLLIAKQSLIKRIYELPDGEKILDTIYHLLLLNIVRIYPYTQDDNTLSFLDNAINYLMNILSKKLIGATI